MTTQDQVNEAQTALANDRALLTAALASPSDMRLVFAQRDVDAAHKIYYDLARKLAHQS